ncbi:helix-turn-helix domain-containing protein [Ruegeria sp. MALMAid1280]|uniref:helix-turn-helix domain-containing protein n=1 Tax=Ruegeria sp. MALMAid1280 TaxID=3411634 RepID=UPI003B9E1D58
MSGKTKKDPFPQTKELIRIAVNHGKSQDEIGRMCRVSQTQVSRWLNGKALANRAQVQTLLQEYGDLLFRAPFKLYQTAATSEKPRQYVRVEGKLILREKFRGVTQNDTTTTLRASIHRQGAVQFALVIEYTNALYPDRNKQTGAMPLITDRLAAWFLEGPLDHSIYIVGLGKLRNLTQHLAGVENTKNFPTLEQLPFLVTEALLNHGYKLDDLVEFKLAE